MATTMAESTELKKVEGGLGKQKSIAADELEWIQLRKEINEAAPLSEGLREKMIRKTKENPVVPLGCLATAGVLGYGLYCMRTGQIQRSQNMMRLRIGAQGFTLFALLVGVGYSAVKKQESK